MKPKVVQTMDIVRFLSAIHALRTRDVDEGGFAVVFGHTGVGKTTAQLFGANLADVHYLVARDSWTVRRMMVDFADVLGIQRHWGADDGVVAAMERLSADPRPVFIDEADFVLKKMPLFHALRSIYDRTQVPVVLALSREGAKRLGSGKRYDRHRRRVSQWIEFRGITKPEADLLVAERVEVGIDPELARRAFDASRGNTAAFVESCRDMEKFAASNGLEQVTPEEWGDRPFRRPGPHGFYPAGQEWD